MATRYNIRIILFSVVTFLFTLINSSCRHNTKQIQKEYNYIEPNYEMFKIVCTDDTLRFGLDEYTYNEIKSFNTFSQGNTEYISLYDRRSQSINIYHFITKNLEKKLQLNNLLKNIKLYKTTVYCRNFDSILVSNLTTLYLMDSSGTINRIINLPQKQRLAWITFENSTNPVLNENVLYAGVSPNAQETSLKDLKEWKVMYEVDLKNKSAYLHYNLPDLYHFNIYGRRLFENNHCYNNHRNFVFSFPADSNIYETNLYSYNKVYYGKSRYQNESIDPVSKEDILNDKGNMNFLLRDSYGAIYFDPNMNRYLRVAQGKLSMSDYLNKKRKKPQRIIIFNENFKIIGESPIDENISLNDLFFTKDGNMYARTRINDEYAICFVRLMYCEYLDKEQTHTAIHTNYK